MVRGHKAASLPADRCQSPLIVSPPGSSVGSGGSSPAVAMSFFARSAASPMSVVILCCYTVVIRVTGVCLMCALIDVDTEITLFVMSSND